MLSGLGPVLGLPIVRVVAEVVAEWLTQFYSGFNVFSYLTLRAILAALTALVMAGMCALAWLFRLSSLVNFISETILLGFKAGAALTIAMTQLPKLFGVKGGGEGFFERLAVLWGQLPDTNLPVLAFGLGALAVLDHPLGRHLRHAQRADHVLSPQPLDPVLVRVQRL